MKRGKRIHFMTFQVCTDGVWSDSFQQITSLEPNGSTTDPLCNHFHCETHYNPAILPRMRMYENGRVFQIDTTVNIDENSREMIINATEFLQIQA